MIKSELQEIKELEKYINKINFQEQTISQLRQDFYLNSQGFARGQIQANILNNQQPQQKLFSFLQNFPQNSYEQLQQIDNYISMIQKGNKDFQLLKTKYKNQRDIIVESEIKTDCLRMMGQQLDEKSLSSPVVQVLLGKLQKQGQTKPLYSLLDNAFSQLQKIKQDQIPRHQGQKIVQIDYLVKNKLKDVFNLLQNMDYILPSIQELN